MTFPQHTDGANDDDSDQSRGKGGKAARMAKQLTAKVATTAAVRHRGFRYYQPPAALRDDKGQIKRCKPGTISLASLRCYQKSVSMLIPLLPFSRLVREIAEDQEKKLSFQSPAIKALQEGAEAYI